MLHVPTLLFESGVIVVQIRHTTRKRNGTLQYQRRVPQDLKEHYGGSVYMPRRSLSGLSPLEAAKKVAAYAKANEAEWASLRAHPSTPEHVQAQVDGRLEKWRKLPKERYADEDPATEAEHLGEVLDDFLLEQYGETYYGLKVDSRYQGNRLAAALRSRLTPLDYETYRRVMGMLSKAPERPPLSRVLEEYLRSKGDTFSNKNGAGVKLSLGVVFKSVGDRPLGDYTRPHANQVRDALGDKGTKKSTVRRRLNDIKAVYNFGRVEFDLTGTSNPFEKLKIAGEGSDSTRRVSFTPDEIVTIAGACHLRDDDVAWIIGLMIETGARLGEVVGLRCEDVFLDAPVPHVWIRPHIALGRSLKTAASVRKVPLVGVSLWAATRACKGTPWLFPRYAEDHNVKADSASAGLNPWLKEVTGTGKTCHCFRHAMIDRLRAAGVPEDERQAIVGHGRKSVSQKYGEGYPLDYLRDQLALVPSGRFKRP